MAPNPRVAKAFRAMREIGIPEEKVKPVLKNLLKLYEKNWELIEEENYRALADAIFDQDESQAEEQKRENERAALEKMEEEAQVNEEPERPLKRLRLRHQQGHASPSVVNSSPRSSVTLLRQPKEEEVELPDETRPRLRSQNVMESSSSQPNTKNKRAGSHPSSSQPLVRNKGKQPVLHNHSAVQEGVDASLLDAGNKTHTLATSGHRSDSVSSAILLKEKGKEPISSQIPINTDRSTHIVCLKEPKLEPGIILTPKQQAHNSNALIKPKDEPVTDDVPQFEIPLAVILPVPDPLNEENSFRINDSVRGPDCPEPRVSHSVHDEDRNDVIPASPNERRPNCGLSNFVDEVSSKLEKASSNNGEEIIAVTPVIDIQKQPIEALDALGGRDKPVGPSNGSTKAQCSAEVARSRVPRHTPSSNGNDCGETKKDTDVCSSEIDKEKELNGFEHANSHYPAVQQRQPTPVGEKPLHDVVDIAKGQEKVVISVVNEVNDECPPSFRYIAQNVVFQNAYVNFSLARIGESCCSTCLGDCLSSPTPCACAHESGGDYAYTSEGLVKEDILKECILMNRDPQKHCLFYCKDCPLERSKNDDIVEQCKGHSVRRFIKECWWKCGCTKHCGNRVVQRGINRNLQVFMTPEGKGWGLRTLEDIPKGAFVCEYVGEILTNAELFDRVSQSASNEEHAYPVLLDADWASEGVLKDEEALCLDATHYGNVARFVNHRCFDSNMVEIPVEVETPDHHYYHLAFFTTRKVKALEELTWDYGIDFDDHDHPVKAFKCHCGSKYCRNMKRVNRSRSGRRR